MPGNWIRSGVFSSGVDAARSTEFSCPDWSRNCNCEWNWDGSVALREFSQDACANCPGLSGLSRLVSPSVSLTCLLDKVLVGLFSWFLSLYECVCVRVWLFARITSTHRVEVYSCPGQWLWLCLRLDPCFHCVLIGFLYGLLLPQLSHIRAAIPIHLPFRCSRLVLIFYCCRNVCLFLTPPSNCSAAWPPPPHRPPSSSPPPFFFGGGPFVRLSICQFSCHSGCCSFSWFLWHKLSSHCRREFFVSHSCSASIWFHFDVHSFAISFDIRFIYFYFRPIGGGYSWFSIRCDCGNIIFLLNAISNFRPFVSFWWPHSLIRIV